MIVGPDCFPQVCCQVEGCTWYQCHGQKSGCPFASDLSGIETDQVSQSGGDSIFITFMSFFISVW